jgi:hypothetical protein
MDDMEKGIVLLSHDNVMTDAYGNEYIQNIRLDSPVFEKLALCLMVYGNKTFIIKEPINMSLDMSKLATFLMETNWNACIFNCQRLGRRRELITLLTFDIPLSSVCDSFQMEHTEYVELCIEVNTCLGEVTIGISNDEESGFNVILSMTLGKMTIFTSNVAE